MSTRRATTVLIVFILSVSVAPPLGAEDATPILEVIAEGYLANRTAFTHGKCRYAFSHGTAATEEDALAGKWSDHWLRATREFVLHFRGDRLSVRAISDEASLAREMRAGGPVISPLNVLVNGEYALDQDGLINTAIMHSPQAWSLNVRYHPFNLAVDSGRGNPAEKIHRYLREQPPDWEMSGRAAAEMAGRQGYQVEYFAPGNSHRTRWLFDPDLGCLPVVTELRNAETGELYKRMFVDRVEHHQGAVFPMRAVSAAPTVDEHGVAFCEVREMQVLELDLDYVLTDADLTIEIPRNTQFQTGIDSQGSKTLYRDSPESLVKISVNDVQPIFNQLLDVAADRAKKEAGVMAVRSPSSTGRSRSSIYWLLIVNFVAIGLFTAVYWRRRRRNDASPRG